MKEQNTTNEAIEVTEVTEVVEVTEKVSVKEKISGFCKKHKKGLIIGATAVVGAAVIGVIKALKGSNDDDLYDYYSEDDYEDSDDVIDVDVNEETTE